MSKEKELKKIHVKGQKGALGSNKHTLGPVVEWTESSVAQFSHLNTFVALSALGLGRMGFFQSLRNGGPGSHPPPDAQPGRRTSGRVLSPRCHRGWRDSCRPSDGHRGAGWGLRQPPWDDEGKTSRKPG